MGETGRYFVVKDGRTFCVEPLHERDQRATDVVFTNGGVSGEGIKSVARGGSVAPDESLITPENGFKNITVLPPGVSPEDWINAQLGK